MGRLKKLKEKIEYFRKRWMKFRYKGIIGLTAVYALIAVILFTERSGVQVNYQHKKWAELPKDSIVTKAEANKSLPQTTLLLWNSQSESSRQAEKEFAVIFADMKVGHKKVDVSKEEVPDFNKYENVVVLLSDVSAIKDSIVPLCEWVHEGGDVLFPLTFEKTAYLSIMESCLGVMEASYDMSVVDGIYLEEGFMVGGGRNFDIMDPYDSAWSVQLNPETTKVYARKKDSDLPLIWEAQYGKGKFVVDNFGLYGKNMRGFFAASYSLLNDVCVYPVINASVFYLDDFPSQVPSGENEYITRDYHTTVRDFYVNIWWPSMMNFADKYNLKYTGLAIMCYNDTVDGSIEESGDDSTFTNFGNMLLRQGGELGYHGYNHQPLCLGNVDYEDFYDYKTWNDYMSMRAGIQGLVDFCDELFPDVEMSVYVPPSNILSAEGRAMLLAEFPEIRTISGTYFPEEEFKYSCVQEFEVTEDGVVDQPRIISGCVINDFMAVAAVSELNMRFINDHFTHPDDALDPDRGALLGWEKLTEEFDSFLNWLYTSAPTIRNLTGSDASVAIQRYVASTVSKTVDKEKMTIKIGNFYDEAQLFVRFNERKYAGKVDGGKLTHLTGDLYLLEATKDTVTISLKQE